MPISRIPKPSPPSALFGNDLWQTVYIANLLEQRARFTPPPSPLHLTRRQDLLELELAPADLSIYETPSSPQ
ncbi:MAG TPA: hypothetical protein VGD78_11690, partial [Chthoniobacterales bacterium]